VLPSEVSLQAGIHSLAEQMKVGEVLQNLQKTFSIFDNWGVDKLDGNKMPVLFGFAD
jgi:hypothetical protein